MDSFYDCWLQPPRPDVTLCYSSAYHRDQHAALYGKVTGPVVGWTPADWLGELGGTYNPDSLVFFSLKRNVPEPWRRSVQGRWWYLRCVFDFRRIAHDWGLRFVVKTREKHGDPFWLRWLADEYVGDESMTPPTSMTVLARARYAVHFQSGGAFEASVMGVPQRSVIVPQGHIIDLPGGRWQYGPEARKDFPCLEPQDGNASERVLDVVERG